MTVFASQVASPISVNYDNPATANLLTCQFDDGTTVTNCITGETGETFDSANLIGVAASSGERVSATWTAAKPNGIDSDPFSLFQTTENFYDDYCITTDGVDDNITFDATTFAGTVSASSYEYEVRLKINSASQFDVVALMGSGRVIFRKSDNLLIWKTASTAELRFNPTGIEIGEWFTLKLVKEPNSTNYSLYIDGVLKQTKSVTAGLTLDKLGQADSGATKSLSFAYFKYLDKLDHRNSRYWEFNKTRGDSVACHFSGYIATLNNFFTDSGYKTQADRIVGYQFGNNTFATIATPIVIADGAKLKCRFDYKHNTIANTFQMLIGVYSNSSGLDFISISTTNHRLDCRIDNQRLSGQTVLLENQDYDLTIERSGTEISIRINGNLEMSWSNVTLDPILGFNTSYSNFRFTGAIYSASYETSDGTVLNNWDFTTDDVSKIVDSAGNNHAAINNIPTTKWQRIIDKKVYTIGSAKDYSTPQNFINGIGANLNVINHGVIYEYFGSETLAKNGADGTVIELVGNTDKHAVSEQKSYGFGGHCIINKSGLFSLKNLTLGSFSGNTNDGNLSIDSCVVDTASTQAINCSFIQKANISKTLFKSYTREAVVGKNTDNTKLQECIFDSSSVTSAVAFNVNNADLHNCLIPKGGCFAALGTVTGSGNVTDTRDAQNKGVGIQDSNLLTYITDSGQINEAGQTALKGKGWNGSDIASAFYLVSSVSSVSSLLTISNYVNGFVSSKVDIRSAIASALESVVSRLDVRNYIADRVSSNVDVRNAIYNKASSSVVLSSSIASGVSSQATISNSIASYTSSLLDVRNSVLRHVAASIELTSVVLESVSAQVDIRNTIAGLISSVSSRLEVSNYIAESAIGLLDVRSSINAVVSSPVDVRYSVLAFVANQLDVSNVICEHVGSPIDVSSQIYSHVSSVLDIRSNLDGIKVAGGLNDVVSFDIDYDVYSLQLAEDVYSFDIDSTIISFDD
ncbi:hypothetical protein J7384_17795 [Endozoicomonas sp. G2_1]|uniref:hypothetical protein n=1 Tax=Endozoicomonas sp. G2_1 TaxID=2821091 RepID=UPI001ADB5D1A|nr:hypothetical protein [Endozoicomonas sp. G2_1]MBO9492219.1 hypothetical protein [Endozoicomonas sp. G2_1]